MKKLLMVLSILVFSVLTSMAGENATKPGASLEQLKGQLAMSPQNPKLLMAVGSAYFQKGVAGDKDAVKEAVSILEYLLKLQPGNAEARSMYGSALTLRGRDAWFPLFKASYVNQGLKEMDRAVELAPDNIRIRMVRGGTSLALPSMFNRLDTAIEDFEYLKNKKETTPDYMDNGTYVSVLYDLGRAYAKKGDLKKSELYLKQVNDMAPKSLIARKATKLMNQLNHNGAK